MNQVYGFIAHEITTRVTLADVNIRFKQNVINITYIYPCGLFLCVILNKPSNTADSVVKQEETVGVKEERGVVISPPINDDKKDDDLITPVTIVDDYNEDIEKKNISTKNCSLYDDVKHKIRIDGGTYRYLPKLNSTTIIAAQKYDSLWGIDATRMASIARQCMLHIHEKVFQSKPTRSTRDNQSLKFHEIPKLDYNTTHFDSYNEHEEAPTSTKSAVARLDRESRLLSHLWSVYTSRCVRRFHEHRDETQCSYSYDLGKRGELAHLVTLALLNLLDANDTERLLQLGCILLLFATKQFSSELDAVFALVDRHVIGSLLRQIDQLCASLEKKPLDTWNIQTVNLKHRTFVAIPRLRVSADATAHPMSATVPPKTFFTIQRNYDKWMMIEPPRLIPRSKHLSRICSINGFCIDLPTIDTLEYINLIPDTVKAYIAYSWVERMNTADNTSSGRNTDSGSYTDTDTNNTTSRKRNTDTTSKIIFVNIALTDGSIITFAENLSDKEITYPLRRLNADRVTIEDNGNINDGNNTYSKTYILDVQRSVPQWTRFTIATLSQKSNGESDVNTIPLITLTPIFDQLWYQIDAKILPMSRNIIIQRISGVHQTTGLNIHSTKFQLFEQSWITIKSNPFTKQEIVIIIEDNVNISFLFNRNIDIPYKISYKNEEGVN